MKKLSISDNDFLVAIRRNDFVKAMTSNKVTDEHFKKYRLVMESKIRLFYNTNRKLLDMMSIQPEDIRQLARCWMVNWVGLHESPNRTNDDNKKLFHVYLRQRLGRLKSILDRKFRSSGLDASRYFDSSDETEPVSVAEIRSRGRVASFKTKKALETLGRDRGIAKLQKIIKFHKDPEVVETAMKHLERLRL